MRNAHTFAIERGETWQAVPLFYCKDPKSCAKIVTDSTQILHIIRILCTDLRARFEKNLCTEIYQSCASAHEPTAKIQIVIQIFFFEIHEMKCVHITNFSF